MKQNSSILFQVGTPLFVGRIGAMAEKPALERVAFSPGEFATLFGKQQTWGYRQIYNGKVKAITEHGRILIPAAEVERILATASRYDGVKKPRVRTKAELQSMKPVLLSAWRIFVQRKRDGKNVAKSNLEAAASSPESSIKKSDARKAALARLTAGKPRRDR